MQNFLASHFVCLTLFAVTTSFALTAAISIGVPVETGKVVKLQHHGTLAGPSGRFEKTDFAAPPVDLSVAPVALPEFTPIYEEQEDTKPSASDIVPQFERMENLPLDYNRQEIASQETPTNNYQSQEVNAAREALYFVRG